MRIVRISMIMTIRLSMIGAVVGTGSSLGAQSAPSQTNTGSIVGQIRQAGTDSLLADVLVQVDGTRIGARTGNDGKYKITGVPAGTVRLIVRRMGFGVKTVPGLVIGAGKTVEQNIGLTSSSMVLADQNITALRRGSVNEALSKQKNATAIVNSITSEQIARSPDGDAAKAVQRVSGVTVQDNKYVFVRGLGERYTTASLNGARLPSPEPEKKVVPLDLFPAGLLQNVTTSKTFTADRPGDFSGAQVDIQTRNFPVRTDINMSTSTGFNVRANRSSIYLAPTVGREWLGFAGAARAMPSVVRAAGNFSGADQEQMNSAIRSFRNVWTPQFKNAGAPYSGSLSAGGHADLLGRKVGYLASGTYGYSQSVRADEQYASVNHLNAVAGETGTISTQWGGLLNFSVPVGTNTRLIFNNTYNRTADNEAQYAAGVDNDNANGNPVKFSTLSFVSRTIRSNQVRVERIFGLDRQLEFAITSAGVTRYEPDRSEMEYARQDDPTTGGLTPYELLTTHPDGARRTFSDLSESNWNVSGDLQLGQIKIGTALRLTNRHAENLSYSMISPTLSHEARQLPAEQIFSSQYVEGSAPYFTIVRNSTGGSYSAHDRVTAGYAMWERPIFDDRLHIIGGLRLETTNIRVHTDLTTGGDSTATLNNVDLLPSLIANIKVSETQNLRFSATQTLARPEYRELSPAPSRDVIKKQDQFGNPGLVRSLIQNFDIRWEWFPSDGEVVSFGTFFKHFNKPIEHVDVATSGASMFSFINADGGTSYGLEGEVRHALPGWLSDLTGFVNATLMHSQIDLSSSTVSSHTNDKRAMVGQAPYVLNTGLTYASESGKLSATVLYNVVGKRIVAAGSTPNPDIYEMARPTLDASVRVPLFSNASLRLNASNLLDRAYEQRQGNVIRARYRSGRSVSFGVGLSR